MSRSIGIVSIAPDDGERLDAIAALHISLLPFGPMSPFGKKFVRALGYELPVRDGSMQIAGMEVDGELVGYIAYTKDARGFYGATIKKHFLHICWLTFRSLIAKPVRIGSVFRALRILRSRTNVDDIPSDTAEITAIAVSPEFSSAEFVRESGVRVSQDLVLFAKDDLRTQGIRVLRGVIDGFNKAAVMMFGHLGASIEKYEQAGESMYVINLKLETD